MTPEASIVVFVVGLAAERAPLLDTTLEDGLGAHESVLVRAESVLPRDVDAFELARSRGATALVELETDADLSRAGLRVCSSATPGAEECTRRTVQFAPGDSVEARIRALSLVAVSMVPEATRREAVARPAPLPAPAPAETRPPSKPPRRDRFEIEATAAATLGGPTTVGAAAAMRFRPVGPLWVHAGAGVRAGGLPSIAATALDVPLVLGVDARFHPGERWSIGARVDVAAQLRSVSFSTVTPEHRSRWLLAFRAGPELHLRCSPRLGLLVFAGVELNAGHTRIELPAGRSALLGIARAAVEVGPYLTF